MKKNTGSIDPISLLLFGTSLLLSIFAAEVLMRWHMFGSDAWSYTMMKSIRHIGKAGVVQASAQQDILWELKPNLDTLYKLKNLKTTADGLRDQEYAIPKQDGVFRIAVIGDSYTMGEGVAAEDQYHTVLENRLNSLQQAIKFEFINFGVAGYSLPQYRATIKHKVPKYQPDLILIGFCAANDSKKPNLEAFNKPFEVKPISNGFFNMFFFEHIGNLYKRVYKYLRNRYPGYNADEAYLNDEFSKLADLTDGLAVPVLVVYLDNRSASGDFAMVKQASERNHFAFIDATTGFSDTINPAHIIYKTDNHPNGAANRIMAEAIFAHLKEVPPFDHYLTQQEANT